MIKKLSIRIFKGICSLIFVCLIHANSDSTNHVNEDLSSLKEEELNLIDQNPDILYVYLDKEIINLFQNLDLLASEELNIFQEHIKNNKIIPHSDIAKAVNIALQIYNQADNLKESEDYNSKITALQELKDNLNTNKDNIFVLASTIRSKNCRKFDNVIIKGKLMVSCLDVFNTARFEGPLIAESDATFESNVDIAQNLRVNKNMTADNITANKLSADNIDTKTLNSQNINTENITSENGTINNLTSTTMNTDVLNVEVINTPSDLPSNICNINSNNVIIGTDLTVTGNPVCNIVTTRQPAEYPFYVDSSKFIVNSDSANIQSTSINIGDPNASTVNIEGLQVNIPSDTNLSGDTTTISSSDTQLTGTNTVISSSNTQLTGTDTVISADNTTISSPNTQLTGEDTVISSSNTQLTGTNTAISGSNTTISSTNTDISGSNISIGNSTSGNINLKSATTIDNELDVAGKTTLSDELDVVGATNLRSTLKVAGVTTLDNELGVAGTTTLSDELDVVGATNLRSTLNVSGDTTLNKASVNGALDVTGATNLSSTLNVFGDTTLNKTSVNDALDVTGVTNLSSTLNVSGDTTLSKTSVNGALDVTGATNLSSTLNVSGDTTLNKASVNGALDVTGATNLSSTLNVSGDTTLGDTNINGEDIKIGLSSLNSNIDVNGNSFTFNGSNICTGLCGECVTGDGSGGCTTVTVGNQTTSNIYIGSDTVDGSRTTNIISRGTIINNQGIATVSLTQGGTAIANYQGTATASDIGGTAIANYGQATASNIGGTAIANAKGQATASLTGGTAIANAKGQAIASYTGGTAIANAEGQATANGVLSGTGGGLAIAVGENSVANASAAFNKTGGFAIATNNAKADASGTNAPGGIAIADGKSGDDQGNTTADATNGGIAIVANGGKNDLTAETSYGRIKLLASDCIVIGNPSNDYGNTSPKILLNGCVYVNGQNITGFNNTDCGCVSGNCPTCRSIAINKVKFLKRLNFGQNPEFKIDNLDHEINGKFNLCANEEEEQIYNICGNIVGDILDFENQLVQLNLIISFDIKDDEEADFSILNDLDTTKFNNQGNTISYRNRSDHSCARINYMMPLSDIRYTDNNKEGKYSMLLTMICTDTQIGKSESTRLGNLEKLLDGFFRDCNIKFVLKKNNKFKRQSMEEIIDEN